MRQKSRLGILGGAFNPPHFGHLKIAKKAVKELGLKKLLLMVAGRPPLKSEDIAPIKDRLAMAKIFASFDPRFKVSTIEIKRAKEGRKSYTIDTLKELKRKYPNKEIYWIIGEDSLREILQGKWEGGTSVLNEAKFVVFNRPGYRIKSKIKNPPRRQAGQKSKTQIKIKEIKLKLKIPISSTEIRKKIKGGEDVSKMAPPKILDYIKKKKLYSYHSNFNS